MNHYSLYERLLEIEKYQIVPILWQFIPEILAWARILIRDLSPKAEHFICWYWFAMFHASCAVSSHLRLLQIEKKYQIGPI